MPLQEVRVPDIGDFNDVEVIEILVAPGDTVAAEDSLITLESDKASMEIPAPSAGTIRDLKIQLGDKLSEGDVIALLESGEASDVAANQNGADDTPAAPAPPAGAAASGSYDVQVPDIGDFDGVEVIELLVKPGDMVQVDDSLITLESDKASMEIPSPKAGTVKALHVKIGDKVAEGHLLATLEVQVGEGDATPEKPASAPHATPEPAPAPAASQSAPQPAAESAAGSSPAAPRGSPTSHIEEAGFRKAHASPAVRRFARELGAELSLIHGTGRKDRILKEDVKAFVKKSLSSASGGAAAGIADGGAGIPRIPEVDFSKWGEIEVRDLKRIQKLSGAHLRRAWLNIPHVTHHDEADVTELEAFRQSLKKEAEQKGVRVTALAFIMKALARTLQEFPHFNASLSSDGESLIVKKYIHLGIAVDTKNGLVVPVFRDVDRKTVFELAEEMADVSARARDGKLKPEEMQGGCMSISSLGGIGGTSFTPIVNAPEVAILGVARSRMTPVWDGKEFTPRLMQPLDLSYDHRVIDGAEAARFVAYLVKLLGDLRRMLL